MDDMTPTDKIRALLDERGIEYVIRVPSNDTAWEHEGTHFTAVERFGKLYLQTSQGPMTPEQAIAATVGVGTCRNVSDPPSGFLCSECGWGDFDEPTHLLKDANFCPNCGREIIQ